ncbi:glycerate kinase [Variovorax sp. PCZ-1]|uniref:glycerate kinase n=1 Tax=Variovorax sp. PCZ-1 TaxID=2835533 RepID=UPI001BCBF99D|nr:glycerate kinase [Variovorax sp. PCZ-1]MBS7808759.1 glycerate kinase [Variovorax sp. PCZ-1]
MNFKSIFLWLAGAALLVVGYQKYGLPGVAVVLGGIVFWMLLHFTRMMTVLKRAANTPMGYVGSAVMLNAKLKKGVNLLHVMALTRSIGLLQTEKDAQPEIYRWQDGGGSFVTCTFMHGKLQSWELFRPAAPATETDLAQAPAAQ